MKKLNVTKIEEDFKIHFEPIHNARIIFSAMFGSGKTTFLKDFFELNQNDYYCIHLFPVNYSIASNEDIFKLIKVDIIYEILNYSKNIAFEETQINFGTKIGFYLKESSNDLLVSFYTIINLLNKDTPEIDFDILIGFYKKLNKFLKKEPKSDFEIIKDLNQEVLKGKGLIYENDIYTELIRNFILQLQKNNKKVVLVIDDLDRIDPDHIFRLLNIFAAHFDYKTSENKFGFDKVILVCDIDNIQNIFHSKFGINTDFNGYIDKFFSSEIFKFDNKDLIMKSITEILAQVNVQGNLKTKFLLKENGNGLYRAILFLLSNMVYFNAIKLRTLHKICTQDIIINTRTINFPDDKNFSSHNFEIILILEFITKIIGEDSGLMKALIKCSKSRFKIPFEYSEELEVLCNNISILTNCVHHKFKIGQSYNTRFPMFDNLSSVLIPLTLSKLGYDFVANKTPNHPSDSYENINVFKSLSDSFEILQDLNFY